MADEEMRPAGLSSHLPPAPRTPPLLVSLRYLTILWHFQLWYPQSQEEEEEASWPLYLNRALAGRNE